VLERQESPDRRVKGVRLTPAGLDLRRKLEARLLVDHPAVRGLSAADQQRLLGILRQLQTP
jgi:DNA-binding MarR family transcriptional regulator